MILLIIGQFHVLQFLWFGGVGFKTQFMCCRIFFAGVSTQPSLHFIPPHHTTASAWFEPKKSFQKSVYTILECNFIKTIVYWCGRVHKKMLGAEILHETPQRQCLVQKVPSCFREKIQFMNHFFPLIDSGVKLYATAFRWISRWPTQ